MARSPESIAQERRLAELEAIGRTRALTDVETDELQDLVRKQQFRRRNDGRRRDAQLATARAKVARYEADRAHVDRKLAAAQARVALLSRGATP